MSGGSYDYFYTKLDDMADSIRLINPERKAFVKHLKKVVKALHDIEWVDSCDYGVNAEIAAIMECVSEREVLDIAVAEAKKVCANLERAIEKASEK